jgi:hypothetical protein
LNGPEATATFFTSHTSSWRDASQPTVAPGFREAPHRNR